MGLEIGSFNPSHLGPIQELQSYRATRASELRNQSFRARYENSEHCESQLKAVIFILVMGKDRSKDENATAKNRENKDHSRDQDTRDISLAKTIAEAVAQQTQAITDVFQRQMEETRAQYEELLKASRAQNFTSTLKVTSSTDGFRVMDPFDWTADKNIYQRWQLWSHNADARSRLP